MQLLIVDGFSLAFRAFYAYPLTLTLPDGTPINVVYGFVSMLFSILDQLKPSHAVVCFDRPEPTFRHQAYEGYKANRSDTPQEFIVQIELLKQAVRDMGIFMYEQPGYEADDLMGVLALKAVAQDIKAQLFTSDQDSFQLIAPNIEVVMPKKGISELAVYDREKVYEKCGVYPEQIVDFKALKGDSSDNIPGVKGVGEKTAARLLQSYNDLEGVYRHLGDISSKSLRSKLETDKDNALLSYNLAKLCLDVELSVDIEDLKLKLNWPDIHRMFTTYKFTRLLTKYAHQFTTFDELSLSDTVASPSIKIVKTSSELKALLPQLKDGFSFDLETTSLCIQDAEIVGVSLSYSTDFGIYIPMNEYVKETALVESVPMFTVGDVSDSSTLPINPLLKVLSSMLEDETVLKVTHHGKYDSQVLKRYGIHVKGMHFDTMIAAFLLYPTQKVGLKDVVQYHFNYTMASFVELVPKGGSFLDISVDQAAKYAGEDAVFTYRLAELFRPLIKQKGFTTLFHDIEVPVQSVLADMEYHGVSIDLDRLNVIRTDLVAQQDVLTEQIYNMAGGPFNINSPQQLAVVLYDQLQLPVLKKTKTGRSTAAAVLEDLKSRHPIVALVSQYRTNEKLLSTYVNALPQLVHPRTGKIHTSFNQTVVITGRLSSSAPNLQNIPIRTEQGQAIRGVFIPQSPTNILMAVDYSQIELRLMAHFSQDTAMIDAFCHGADIHRSTAALLFHCEQDAVTKEQRYQAKGVNFGIIYGISAFGLSKNIHVSRSEAQAMIDAYFERFPGIKTFMDSTIDQAKRAGGVHTDFGRWRPLPLINGSDRAKRHFEERAAVNTVLQGTAADIMKLAMVRISESFQSHQIQSKMIIQVHDELVFDVLPDELEWVQSCVVKEMETVVKYRVPLLVDVECANSWLFVGDD